MSGIDCVNYVITHKPCEIKQDGLYRGLCVGGLRLDGMMCELDGENIAEYNERINETTGLYWMWKNADSEYLGLSHYRRWFFNARYPGDESRLDAERIEEILVLNGYDMILTNQYVFHDSVFDGIVSSINYNYALAVEGYNVFLEELREKHPEYVSAFHGVMKDRPAYLKGMFVTRREIVNAYCEWLFSFLPEAADRIDVSGFSPGARERRVAGFFAEFLWTVWMSMHKYRVFTLPYPLV